MGSPYIDAPSKRYRQGDILRDVEIAAWAETVDSTINVVHRKVRYAVVVSQECDLEHDYNNRNDKEKYKDSTDKYLQSILLCPAYPALQLKEGTHVPNEPKQRLGSDLWKSVRNNNNYRYHALPEAYEFQVPELILDFKHYLTIPPEYAYRPQFKACVLAALGDLFREHMSHRFAHYLSRVGLPEPV